MEIEGIDVNEYSNEFVGCGWGLTASSEFYEITTKVPQ